MHILYRFFSNFLWVYIRSILILCSLCLNFVLRQFFPQICWKLASQSPFRYAPTSTEHNIRPWLEEMYVFQIDSPPSSLWFLFRYQWESLLSSYCFWNSFHTLIMWLKKKRIPKPHWNIPGAWWPFLGVPRNGTDTANWNFVSNDYKQFPQFLRTFLGYSCFYPSSFTEK